MPAAKAHACAQGDYPEAPPTAAMDGNASISVRRHAPAAGTRGPCGSWSRRRLLADGLLTLAAAPAWARALAARSNPGPPTLGSAGTAANASAAGSSGAVRTAAAAGDRLTAAVHINGAGPYHFLVDTGAERTLIAADLATQLALPRGAQVLVEGIIRGEPAALVRIERLDLGGLLCLDLLVPELPRTMLRVDGYLGLDVLDRHRVIFDFRHHTLTVTRPQGFFAALFSHGDEAIVRTLGRSGRLRATDCRVNGQAAAAFIDTGAEVSVCNPALYAQLQRRSANRQPASGPVGLYGVTGGSLTGLEINVDRIDMGELELTYTNLVVAPLEVFEVWGLRAQPALLLGMDALRRFARVSIDYGRKELRFELARAPAPQPLEAGLAPPLSG
jgi:predicted aspartyl protease